MIIKEKDIGGASVRKVFSMRQEMVMPGTDLSRETLLAMTVNNRQSLIDNGYIVIYPPHPIQGNGEVFVYSRGFGKFDVLEGHKVNEEPLTKEEAEALAAQMRPGADPIDPVEPPVAN